MANSEQPFISADQNLAEITLKVVILSIILATVLAVANTYLALKIGLLTSASIPAAVISMGILRFFKNATILENNLVQTAASAGEAVAGGIVYTVPALIIIGYWHQFSYWQNVWIAFLGGSLGVMFSIPLRRFLMKEPNLRFPEGRAIAAILEATAMGVSGFRHLVLGGVAGSLIELAQTGFKLLASSWQWWLGYHRSVIGFGVGFSPVMIGAGYLIGSDLALSIFCGAILNWLITLPVIGMVYPNASLLDPTSLMQSIWQTHDIFVGIGALVSAGVWTLLQKTPEFITSLQVTMTKLKVAKQQTTLRTEYDIPLPYVLMITAGLMLGIVIYVWHYFPMSVLDLGKTGSMLVALFILIYILVVGFISSAITAYFSGMVGVTATPGSAIVIGGMTLAALGLYCILHLSHAVLLASQLQAAAGIAILVGAFITGAAAISNDNMQDLKVGHLLGATPWKQQVMLLLGVLVAALVIPPVMQLLFDVYGIAGVMPHSGMDPSASLAAPPAAMMAVLAKAVFSHDLPWNMVLLGVGMMAVVIALLHLPSKTLRKLSPLGIAIGMYLSLSSSIPIVLGGLIAHLVARKSHKKKHNGGMLIACGLVAGASLMDVCLALPFSYYHNPEILSLLGKSWQNVAAILSVIVTLLLGAWFMYDAQQEKE